MLPDDTRKKLAHITGGTVIEGQGDTCTSVRNYLCTGFGTSRTVKKDFESQSLIKEKQAGELRNFAIFNNLIITDLPDESHYLTRGGEAKVYLVPDGKHVIKLNDAIYYATWLEYFNSLVIHNLLFPDTAYSFLGFASINDQMLAVVRQPFIEAGEMAELDNIRQLLSFNGFENTRRQDYYNREFGLILEDMHDENVLAKDNILFFIDTVFYTVATGSDL